MLIQLHKAFFLAVRFSDSVHKYFINQTTLDLKKKKMFFLKSRFACTSLIELERPIIITFWIFLVKDLTNQVLFSSDHNYWEHIFLARKNGWPISATLMAYFYHPQQIGTVLENDDWRQLSSKKIEKFIWKLKEYKPYPSGHGGRANLAPLFLVRVKIKFCFLN